MTPEAQARQTLVELMDGKMNRQLMYYLDICVRCSICKDACHQYVTTGDVLYLPAYRADLIRKIYKKHLTRSGRLVPYLFEGRDPDDERLLNALYQTTYACTGCRRCMYYCPFSIDTTWVLAIAKTLLIATGRGSEILSQLAGAAIDKGKNIDLYTNVIREVLKGPEEELRQKVGDPNAGFVYDKEGADVLYVALAGTHTILPAAIIFHQAGEDWTLSSFEGSNYGFFLGDAAQAKEIADRIVNEAKRLRVKEIVMTECGHAHRVLKYFYEAWAKEPLPVPMTSILTKIDGYMRDGRLTVEAGKVTDPVTYHDPCQIGRNFGLFEEPRDIVRAVCSDFREMTPNRQNQWCCGGGGGLVAEPEFDTLRMKSGQIKADQIKATGARIVVTPCENCRLQIGALNDHYGLDVKVSAVMDLVTDALVIKPPSAAPSPAE
jgi:Fe-S oxidoreductase